MKAANAYMPTGTAVPAFTYALSGFVDGDPSSVASGAPPETTTAISVSPQGPFAITITQGTLGAANYALPSSTEPDGLPTADTRLQPERDADASDDPGKQCLPSDSHRREEGSGTDPCMPEVRSHAAPLGDCSRLDCLGVRFLFIPKWLYRVLALLVSC
jgi:hypothetical protein